MKRTKLATAFACFLLSVWVVAPPRMMAQGLFGTISGVITDSSGAVVVGATVQLTHLDTNVTKTLTTNNAGVYSATSLNPGVYRVEASASGFKTAIVSAVTLEVNANPKVDLTLQVGEASETVDVTAEAPLLQTQQSNLGQTVTQRQIEQLPTGRNLFSLILLAAGTSQQAACDGCGNNGNLRINGDRPRTQDYILDGTTINAPVFGGQAVNPAVDSIQEFKSKPTVCLPNTARPVAGLLLRSQRAAPTSSMVLGTTTIATKSSTHVIFSKILPNQRIHLTRTSLAGHSADPSSKTNCSFSRTTRESARMETALSPAWLRPTLLSGAAIFRPFARQGLTVLALVWTRANRSTIQAPAR